MKNNTNIWLEYPHLIEQWHKERNENLSLNDFTIGSKKKVWWKCDKGPDHEWEAIINNRVRGRNCPFCGNRKPSVTNNLDNYPELVKEFDVKANNVKPSNVVAAGTKRYFWKCKNGHNWKAAMRDRIKGGKCLKCSGKEASEDNNFKIAQPNLSKFWDYDKNNRTPEDFLPSSNKMMHWKCGISDDHIWQEKICNMTTSYQGCPFCSNHRVSKTNNLLKIHPKIAKEWHPEKNKGLTPDKVLYNSGKKVWWKCDKGLDHEWPTTINERTPPRPRGCPVCSNLKKVKSNILTTTHPELVKEWDYDANIKKPSEYVAGSDAMIHWICSVNNNHKWTARLNFRALRNVGCPKCNIQGVSKQELGILFELKYIFPSISEYGFKPASKSHVDIFIKEINLIIEYDGYYFHKEKYKKDKLKTEDLIELNYNVLRLRENPLEKIFNSDIKIPSYNNYNCYDTVVSILNYIFINFPNLDKKKQKKAEEYIKANKLQNEDIYNKHIANIFKQDDSYGQEIRKIRTKNDISVKLIAERMKVHPNTILRYETNKRKINYKTYSKIIDFMDSIIKKK